MTRLTGWYVCSTDGCSRGFATGHALYRTSLKGAVFQGVCAEHLDGPADPVVEALERPKQQPRPE